MNETETTLKIEITFPIDMLWQDVSEDDYDEALTCNTYEADVISALSGFGYDAEIGWALVSRMMIEDENGEPVVSSDYNHIRTIIDQIEVDYIAS